jgi:transcription-repair coupling factor (superfamily II helicase)
MALTDTVEIDKPRQVGLGAFAELFTRSSNVQRLVGRIRESESPYAISVSGLAGSARAFLLNTLLSELRRPLLYVCAQPEDGFSIAQDLESLPCASQTHHFPSLRINPYDFAVPSGEMLGRRISSLASMKSKTPGVFVAPLKALMEPTITPGELASQSAHLQVGSELGLEKLAEFLVSLGFRRAANVEEVGDFSLRGGLVDFFSPGFTSPMRIEFFGDAVDSIRTFDVTDQRTREQLQECHLLPRREYPYHAEQVETFLESVSSSEEELLRTRFVSDPEAPGLEWLAPAFGTKYSSVLAHFPTRGIIVTDNLDALQEEATVILREGIQRQERMESSLPSLFGIKPFYSEPTELLSDSAKRSRIDIRMFRGSSPDVVELGCKEPPPIGAKMDKLAEVVAAYRIAKISYIICADNPGQAERLSDLIRDNVPGEDPQVVVALLQGGWFSPDGKFSILTDHQIFKSAYRRRKRKYFKEGVTISSYTNLEPRDYVVHTEHGVARYLGLETITLDERRRDCLTLQYAKSDKLFVPIEEFNRVSKYAGKDASPSLSTLGAQGWENLKTRAKKSIEEMAERLVRLYAERKANPGFAFGPDTTWMCQLEASFPYEETEDQLAAINMVKKDMENPSPMDRLICGDVGFGKTEVAVRAALKCVEAGKQVAVLVPTTILAQQHFDTFSERLKEFPIRIDLMSRFRTAKELRATEDAVREGKADILIGTHRILNKKVSFRDLGLLVIDEEQRFGVKHKERLREFRTSIDTITLTATPIPRTLQMSLSGAHDMSLIASSPRGRLPINTVVSEFSAEIIAEAVLREVDRDMQVFFVHNRVQSMPAVRNYLRRLLPQVSILVAHGQMPERELESVMMQFVEKKAQMLLCTSIIESGLDIPNVNTIILDRADRFGMGQLYQLRGRVGRSSEQAYSYFLTPGYRRMTEEARRRLKAIESHTELGSGFALAMRDLEIRGAGNMLGARQSGFIDEIGFDMYTKLLEEAVAELRGEATRALSDVTLESDAELLLPDSYIDIKQHKVDIYRRLAQATSLSRVWRIHDEIVDRYGRLPQVAENLIEATAVKILASELGVAKVRVKSGRVELHYEPTKALGRSDIERLRQAIEEHMEFSFSPHAKVVIDHSAVIADNSLRHLRQELEVIGRDE